MEAKQVNIGVFGDSLVVDVTYVYKKALKAAKNFLTRFESINFILGRSGMFDHIFLAALCDLKKEVGYKNFSVSLVLPCAAEEYSKAYKGAERYFDKIEIFSQDTSLSAKDALLKRDKCVIKNSKLIIFYSKKHSPALLEALDYAEKCEVLKLDVLSR